jgi:hypothetical protein
MTPSSSQHFALAAGLPAEPANVMRTDLCVLTAHLLLHVLEIDRSYARARTRHVDMQPLGNKP